VAEGGVFSRPMVFALTATMAIALALSIWLQLTVRDDGVTVQPSTYSRSAIGHVVLYETLRRLDLPVARNRLEGAQGLGNRDVLVLAEPNISPFFREVGFALTVQTTVLLVLPKREGSPDPRHPAWIGRANLLPTDRVTALLTYFTGKGEVVREPSPANWSLNRLGSSPTLADQVQLIRSTRITPIVQDKAGILVGEFRDRNRRIIILSDPDLIENHGVALGENAQFFVGLLNMLRGQGGRVIFDETAHGLTGGATSPLRLLFGFPYILIIPQLFVALALLLLATMTRFGVQEMLPPPLRLGKSSLIENGAAMLRRAGRRAEISQRYLQVMLRETGRRLHAPADLREQELALWLDHVATARGIAVKPSTVMREVSQISGRDDPRALASLASAARALHEFNGALSNGPSSSTNGR